MTTARYVAFRGSKRLARGTLLDVALAASSAQEQEPTSRIAVFNESDGAICDLNLQGGPAKIRKRYAPKPPKARGPGRPKLGVVSREISLLPEHWKWLAEQNGGASAALRRLVHKAKKEGAQGRAQQRVIHRAYSFLSDMAANEENFEEACRALFAGQFTKLRGLARPWPDDIREELDRFLEQDREPI